MEGSGLFKTAPGVRLREEPGDCVLVYFDENGYETNAVGSHIIQCARDNAKSVEDLCESVIKEFDAPRDQVRSDIENVVKEFVQIGVLVRQET